MQVTEIKGVDGARAETLAAAGLRTVRDIQLATDEKLAELLGDAFKKVRKQVGKLVLDETGRNDYLLTLNVKTEKDLDVVPVSVQTGVAHEKAAGTRKARFRIWRQGLNGAKGQFQEYEIEVPRGATILQALHLIKDDQDPTLSFRRSCGQAICGICAVRVNRIPKLVCNTLVDHVLEHQEEIVLEPLGNLPTIRDLVCDRRPFWEAVQRLKPWLIRSKDEILGPDKESLMLPEDLPDVIQMANCINCAVCFSDCDARRGDDKFLGPMAAAKVYRFVADPRDAAYEERLKMVEDSGLWRCMFAYQCAWCPKGVEPQDAIAALRRHKIEKDGYAHPGAKHSLAFVESATENGRLNEAFLPVITNGLVKSLREIPKAIKWAWRGKRPRVEFLSARHEVSRMKIVLEMDKDERGRKDAEKRATEKRTEGGNGA